jgi:predicted XRE-type DNA-binding protein
MKNVKATKAGHVTKGDVLNDLELSPAELAELKVKADLWRDLIACITPLRLTQKELAQRLGVHQPEVSHLLAGKLSKFSFGSLIQFAVKMGLDVKMKVTGGKRVRGAVKSIQAKGAGRRGETHSVVAGN